MDEYYTYLKAVKDGDADLDGQTDDEYPISGCFEHDPFSILTPILAAYGYALSFSTGSGTTYVDVIDDKVTYVPTEANFKEILAYMNGFTQSNCWITNSSPRLKTSEMQNCLGQSCCVRRLGTLAIICRTRNCTANGNGLEPMTSAVNQEKIWAAHDVKLLGQFTITTNAPIPRTCFVLLIGALLKRLT